MADEENGTGYVIWAFILGIPTGIALFLTDFPSELWVNNHKLVWTPISTINYVHVFLRALFIVSLGLLLGGEGSLQEEKERKTSSGGVVINPPWAFMQIAGFLGIIYAVVLIIRYLYLLIAKII